MTLEFEKFKSYAQDFVSLSSKLCDEWFIRTIDIAGTEDLYLEKRILKSNIEKLDTKDCDNSNEDETEQAEPTITTYVYHIIYSQSYSVPVLCFNAHHQDGKLLTLEEIWELIPPCYTNAGVNKWNMLTQQEHPKLGIPCFMIHPCHTQDLVSPCSTSNYIITWLSIVGPAVGLTLSLEYAKFA